MVSLNLWTVIYAVPVLGRVLCSTCVLLKSTVIYFLLVTFRKTLSCQAELQLLHFLSIGFIIEEVEPHHCSVISKLNSYFEMLELALT